MDKTLNKYAFIDSQNLNLGVRELGWKLDYARFRVYLREKYGVEKAYLFIGYMPQNTGLYALQGKLSAILVPNQKKYSALLKFDIFKPYLRFVSDLRAKLEYIPKKKNPRKDRTLKGKSSIGDSPIIAKKPAPVNKRRRKAK